MPPRPERTGGSGGKAFFSGSVEWRSGFDSRVGRMSVRLGLFFLLTIVRFTGHERKRNPKVMKRSRNRFLCSLIFGFMMMGVWCAGAQPLARGGKVCSEIVNQNSLDSLVLTHAGEELSLWLGKLIGEAVPRSKAPADAATKIIMGTPSSSELIA